MKFSKIHLAIIIILCISILLIVPILIIRYKNNKLNHVVHEDAQPASKAKPFAMPLTMDENGILLGQIMYKGKPLTVCIDSGSDNLVLANSSCEGCDMEKGSLVSPGRLVGGKDVLYFGTQTDDVNFHRLDIDIHGYSVTADKSTPSVLSHTLNAAITLNRSGSSNYNIMGIGLAMSSDSFSEQVPYDNFMIVLGSNKGYLYMYNNSDIIYDFTSKNMAYAQVSSSLMYSILPQSIIICGQSISGYDVVIDSGSNMLTLPESLYYLFERTSESERQIMISLTPSLSLDLKSHNFTMNGQSLVDKNQIKNFDQKIIIGSLYLKNMAIAFEKDRIGFARLDNMRSNQILSLMNHGNTITQY